MTKKRSFCILLLVLSMYVCTSYILPKRDHSIYTEPRKNAFFLNVLFARLLLLLLVRSQTETQADTQSSRATPSRAWRDTDRERERQTQGLHLPSALMSALSTLSMSTCRAHLTFGRSPDAK